MCPFLLSKPSQEWEWEHAGFGKHRAPLGLPMHVGATFESYMDALEEAQAELLKVDDVKTAARRKMMEHVAVQVAQYQILLGRNARALQKKKEFRYYELPRLFRVRPVMADKMVVELIEANQALLDQITDLVAKNEKIATLDSMALVDFAE